MTEPFDEHGEVLRRALRAEADQVMPSMDGLDRIRSRTAAAHAKAPTGWAAWFTASWTRPLVAVGAAVLVALVAVSAPPAINHITSLTSDQGSSPHHSKSPTSDLSPSNGRSYPVVPGTLPPGHQSQPVLPPPSGLAGGATNCPTLTPDPSRSPKPTPTPSRHQDRNSQRGGNTAIPCPSPSAPSSSPTTQPTTPAPSSTPSTTITPQGSPPAGGQNTNTK